MSEIEVTNKQFVSLLSQTNSIKSSLLARCIVFNDSETDLSTYDLEQLTKYNIYLKQVVKDNKPAHVKKEKEPVQPKQVKKDDLEDEDELTKEEKITFATVCNMEDAKRSFFSNEFDEFVSHIGKEKELKFYKANYKWANDNTGRPDFASRNLLRGFVQNLDAYRKYLLVCFRCILVNKETKEYRYPSYWIVNTDVDLKTLLGSIYDDFDFIQVSEDDRVHSLLTKMRKHEDEIDDAFVGEMYLH
jgi:hypothetical protein